MKNEHPMKEIPENVYLQNRNFYMFNIKARKEIANNLNSAERKVANVLIDNINYNNNTVIATYNRLIKLAHVSRSTVSMALKKLVHLSIIKHITGIIYFNPLCILTGSEYKRKQLQRIYESIPK